MTTWTPLHKAVTLTALRQLLDDGEASATNTLLSWGDVERPEEIDVLKTIEECIQAVHNNTTTLPTISRPPKLPADFKITDHDTDVLVTEHGYKIVYMADKPDNLGRYFVAYQVPDKDNQIEATYVDERGRLVIKGVGTVAQAIYPLWTDNFNDYLLSIVISEIYLDGRLRLYLTAQEVSEEDQPVGIMGLESVWAVINNYSDDYKKRKPWHSICCLVVSPDDLLNLINDLDNAWPAIEAELAERAADKEAISTAQIKEMASTK